MRELGHSEIEEDEKEQEEDRAREESYFSLALGMFSDSFHFLIDLQRKRRQLNMVFF